MEIAPLELERLLDEMIKLRRGMRVGDFATYLREIEKRGFGRTQVQFVIGLVAIFWGRAQFDGMEFDFNDQLEIRISGATHHLSLSKLDAYGVVARRASALETNWLNAIVRAYSTEYAELMPRLRNGIVGEIQLTNPTIHLDAA